MTQQLSIGTQDLSFKGLSEMTIMKASALIVFSLIAIGSTPGFADDTTAPRDHSADLAPGDASTDDGAFELDDDLTDLSLEELMDLEVTSVSKKKESLRNAPAAIYVITQEDLRRSGVESIP
jgi:hypothetical protein